jgi:hypothetical protein
MAFKAKRVQSISSKNFFLELFSNSTPTLLAQGPNLRIIFDENASTFLKLLAFPSENNILP